MKLGQVKSEGGLMAAIFEDDSVRLIEGMSLLHLLDRAEHEGIALSKLADHLAGPKRAPMAPAIPIVPPELWACGCTYEQSAAFRDGEHNTREGFYHYVYQAANRPEVFMKGTGRTAVGPGEAIGIRRDSKFTAPEPELALVLGKKGHIVGFALANDVSAWDIERENPLYLTQSKVYNGATALGPYLITADSVADPKALLIKCVVHRKGEVMFSGETSTSRLNRPLEVLVEYLTRANDVPVGTVMMTGTGIIATQESALAEGDEVSIEIDGFGRLTNPCAIV